MDHAGEQPERGTPRPDVLVLLFVLCLVVTTWCALALAHGPPDGSPAAPPPTTAADLG